MTTRNTGRRYHRWGLMDEEGESACERCGLLHRTDHYSDAAGTVLLVDVWLAPQDRRPVAIMPHADTLAPASAPPLASAYPGVPVTGAPDCPQEPGRW